MKRYVTVAGPDTDPSPGTGLSVLDRKRAGRELEVTVWGEEWSVVDRLEANGASVREITRLSLEEAAVTLMEHGERTEVPR